MTPHAHAKLAPSAAERWGRCPGSVALSEGLPDETSVYAEEGTRAHEVAARILRDPAPLVGVLGASDEDCAAMQRYVGAVTSVVDDQKHLYVEQPVMLSLDLWGTADAIVWRETDRELHTFDLKWGRGIACDVETSEQLRIYGLGALQLYPQAETVYLHVVQPRHRLVGHQWITMTSHQLELWGAGPLASAVERALDPDAPRVPGGHCRFCRAKNICPERNQ